MRRRAPWQRAHRLAPRLRRTPSFSVALRRSLSPFVALCLSLILSAPLHSQRPATLTVSIAPSTVVVGEPFSVRLRVRAPAGATIRFPAVPDSANSIEATDPRAIEDSSTAERFDKTAVYRFLAWETGRRDVPLGDVRAESSRGTEVLPHAPIQVEVSSLLPADSGQHAAKGARDFIDAPPAWWRIGLALAAVGAIAVMLWRMWRRRRRAAPRLDPHAEAQASFAAVDELALVDAGEPGRAVLANAEVMRRYLARRFPAAGEGLTTGEFVRVLETHDLPILPDEVRSVLDAADAVKFAGMAVDAERVRLHTSAARAVVRDVQMAYEARLAALDRGKGPKGRRGRR